MNNCVASTFLFLSIALSSVCSFSAAPKPLLWGAEAITRTSSELSALLDDKENVVYVVDVARVKRILKTLERLERMAGTSSKLWLVYSGDNAPNAFAFVKDGVGQIVVTTSVLDLLGDDLDAYAFVLGHELGHVVKSHGLQQHYLAKMMKFSRELNPNNFSGRLGYGIKDEASFSAAFYGASFGRDQERQADSLGLEYMRHAGYDLRGASRFFRSISSLSRSERPLFLRTHPSDEERASNIEREIKLVANLGGRDSASVRQANASLESNISIYSPGDEGLARIAEVIAIVGREFVSPVDNQQLIAGCLRGLDFGSGVTPGFDADLSLKDIVEAISMGNKARPKNFVRKRTNSCVDGMLMALDRRSYRIDRDEDQLSQSPALAAGAGLELKIQDEIPKIVSVLEKGPAARAKLEVGDLLTGIDGVSTKGLTNAQVVRKLRGAAGSSVTLSLERPGVSATNRVELIREVVKVPSIDFYMLPSHYAHLKIRSFGVKTLEHLGDMLRSLKNDGGPVYGIIVDVRNNSGGLLPSCVGVASAFLADNLLVVETIGRTGDSKLRLVASPDSYVRPGAANPLAHLPQHIKTLPMVVLVNKDTAACSEIVAAALQDHKRALILGERTQGFGSISRNFSLKNDDVLSLTTALFRRPNGEATSDIGVIPDVTLSSKIEGTVTGRDTQLEEAIKMLSARGTHSPETTIGLPLTD